MLIDLHKLTNPFLKAYLEYVEDTESPRQFHIWSALAGISACLGRRAYLPFGHSRIYGNEFVVLCGPPAARKGSAMKVAQHFVKKYTKIRIAPSDTGGQRQGLIKALEGTILQDREFDSLLTGQVDTAEQLDALANVQINCDPRDVHYLFAISMEMNSLIGTKNPDLLTFLQTVYDGDDYTYQLKTTELVLNDPLMTVLAASTPTAIAQAIPQEATGQGFMSRIVFVYEKDRYKDIPWPEPLDEKLEETLGCVFQTVHTQFNDPFAVDAGAKELAMMLYSAEVKIKDPRFLHYTARRYTHLLKLCMMLAAARLSTTISIEDVQDAQLLLASAELTMPDALGEYGFSPLGAAKQKLLELIMAAREPMLQKVLYNLMYKDMKLPDFVTTLGELVNAGKIREVNTSDGAAFVYKDDNRDARESLLRLVRTPEKATPIARVVSINTEKKD